MMKLKTFMPQSIHTRIRSPYSITFAPKKTDMDTDVWYVVAFVAASVGGVIGWLFYLQRKSVIEEGNKVEGSKLMQLQAYERLAVLVERISMGNVISRVSRPEFSARDMQLAIVQNINEEFSYNISQQIYVSAEAWGALKNLKEQNLLLLNQVGSIIPADATGFVFNKAILEFLAEDKRGKLHEVVSEVISIEAKKLL